MKISAASALVALAVAGAGLAAFPALSQERGQDRGQDRRDSPESLLPPGFGDAPAAPDQPAPTAPAPPSGAPATPRPATPAGNAGAGTTPPRSVGELLDQLAAGETPLDEDAEEQAATAPRYDLDPAQRRSLAQVGWIGSEAGGVPVNGWGTTDGRFLTTVMRRLDAPVASRWLSIALRRALMSRTATPGGVNGADFAAERAWLLIRMGEARAALAMVQAVDIDNTTPKLAMVAMQAALANGDPGAICPIAESVQDGSADASWMLSRAMCAGLAGDSGTAGSLIEQARRKRQGAAVDVQLAEKVVGAGANSRRAVTIEWDDVTQLTAWRYGLAVATGVAIPASLFQTVGSHVQAWRAQAPMLDATQRAGTAAMAASLGVLSSRAYVDLVADAEASDDATPAEGALASDLRDAYIGGTAGERLTALRRIWDGASSASERNARAVLTARAAARIPVDEAYVEHAERIVASLLTGGFDTTAARWSRVVAEGSPAWAMLAVATPRIGGALSAGQVESFATAHGRTRAALLLAGLAGLDRIAIDDANAASGTIGAGLGRETAWTRAIDTAARRGEQGTVILLAGTGLQTANWEAVPPFALYRIVAALRRVGLDGYARMIAAEAVART